MGYLPKGTKFVQGNFLPSSNIPNNLDRFYCYKAQNETLQITGAWSQEIARFINDNNVKSVQFADFENFCWDSFDFLTDIPNIEELDILCLGLKGLKSINELIHLKGLYLRSDFNDKKLDLAGLKNLEACFINWGGGAESIFENTSLKVAYFDRIKLKDWNEFERMSSLVELTIGNSNFNDFKNISATETLRKLEVFNCRKLESFHGIDKLANLAVLSVEGCKKFTAIEPLSKLLNLKILGLSNNGKISSFIPLHSLSELNALFFSGTTNVMDGDLNFLDKLSNLSLINFPNKKHYSHKCNELRLWDKFGCKLDYITKK